MEEAVQKELVSVGDFAVLTDRIRMRECKPQKYGTQSYTVTVDDRQVIYIWPVEDAKMLNELRNEIGVVILNHISRSLRQRQAVR